MAWARSYPTDTGTRAAERLSARRVSMIDAPTDPSVATFARGFDQRVLLTVDTEEEFDWNGPFSRDQYGLRHVRAIARFQSFCEHIGAYPVYLVDWPIAGDPRAIEIIGDAVRRGAADVGAQLHPWVNPPFDEKISPRNSYPGSLPRELEAAKFIRLRDRIEESFGAAPLIYRAGRYGLGPNSAEILKAGGIKIDTSVRSLFDYRAQVGPDYSRHPVAPYWVDEDRTLLEAPMTSVYWGPMRTVGQGLQRIGAHLPMLMGSLSRLGLLERISLTPEGVTVEEAIRGLDIALEDGLPLIVFSFHSPSLAPGFTPYTQTDSDVEALYDWFAQVYAHLTQRGVRSTTIAEIIGAVGG